MKTTNLFQVQAGYVNSIKNKFIVASPVFSLKPLSISVTCILKYMFKQIEIVTVNVAIFKS